MPGQIVDHLRVNVRRLSENIQSRPLRRSRDLRPHAHMTALTRAKWLAIFDPHRSAPRGRVPLLAGTCRLS
jgi:hypothetical protein